MEIKLENIKVRDVFEGYVNNADEGVFGYGGKLNIRPKFQREYVYGPKERDMVIDTISKNFPLNVMYWSINEDGTYELMDGQQRTISICEFVAGEYSIDNKYFFNLSEDKQNEILDYELSVYVCTGSEDEKLDWFRTINIAGIQLSEQELRNAVYTGPWLTDAKKRFSKPNAPGYVIGKDYINGQPKRQDFLEKAILWKAIEMGITIEEYMARFQHASNADDLWLHYEKVINWVKSIFPKYRKEMKGIDWGALYNDNSKNTYSPTELDKQIKELMMDDDVVKKSGIYSYVLTGDEKHLSIRAFTPTMKRSVYEKQNGICKLCGEHFEIDEMEADHIDPWSQGGKTEIGNCQMLCRPCNRRKSSK